MRKQSDATQLRHVKRELKAAMMAGQSAREQVRLQRAAGQGMSNICYNFSQQARFTEDERELFRRCYKAWDEVKR